MVYLAKGSFWLTFGQVFVSLSSFLLAIAYANLLPKEAFGTYKYVLSIGGILGSFTLTGLGTALSRAVALNPNESLKKAFILQLKWSLSVTVAAGLTALYYLYQGNTTLGLAVIIVGIFSPISQAGGLYISFLQGKKDFKRKALYDILYNLVPVAIIFVALLMTNDPLQLIFVYFVAFTGISIILYDKTLHIYPSLITNSLSNETVKYSKHLSVMNLLNIGASQIDKILIFHFLGPIQLAVYTFALAPISQFMNFLRSVNIISLPKFSEASIETIKNTLPAKIRPLYIFLFIIVAIYFVVAPLVYKYLFPQYLEAIIYSQLYALILFTFPQEFKKTVLVAHSKEKLLYINTISGPLIKILLLAILLYYFGVLGAILALVVAGLINNLVISALFKKI
jgi:O-antigen/teichoic acid export membrane protein